MAFTVFSIFTSLQFTVGTLPFCLRCIAEGRVAFKRLEKFLMLPEHSKPDTGGEDLKQQGLSIKINIASLGWAKSEAPEEKKEEEKKEKKEEEKEKKEKEDKEMPNGDVKTEESQSFVPCLFDLDVEVKEKELVGIAGSVGAGKSSLLSAVLGEMTLTQGEVKVGGTLAYVSQQAWIFNATIRENILVGSPFEREKYENVIKACSLETDIKTFPEGDLTEIGELYIKRYK